MLHFVLEDINPTIAKDFALFLKEMNDITVLITVASGPFVTSDSVVVEEGSNLSRFKLSEGGYETKFKGKTENGAVVSGYFEVFEDQKRLLEVSYSIKPKAAISLRAKLNCEGEYLVREELERGFERDFSQEAHDHMKTPLHELRKPKQDILDEVDALPIEDTETPIENNEALINDETEVYVEPAVDDLEDLEEITEELSELTQKVQDAIIDTRSMIALLNNLSHDLTRGATINFSEYRLETKMLENGAKVEMLDDESKEYKITFRKGSIDEMTEVSFFLEKDGLLIFNVYFSSEGVGRITATSSQSNVIFKAVKFHLL